ncbi:MAG: DnaD domain protein [Clostridia bacterium]|nr:DnaD domain protein [Clostridia bacterium]
MKYDIKIKKGEESISLPKKRIVELLSECSETELKALIAIAADGDRERAMELSSLDESEFSSALSFWRGAGVIARASAKRTSRTEDKSISDEKKSVAETRPEDAIAIFEGSDIPEYTSADIKRLKGKDKLFNSILDEAQETFGKVFNNVEHNYIIAMRDHLALDGEYILMLLEYFRREGKPLCYVVRVADSLVKKGITDPEALDKYLKCRDSFKGNEGKYRDLFGIGSRALTAYEEKYFTLWSEEMKVPFELVRVAFERTVEKKGTPQKSYINGILKKWQEANVKTLEELESYEQSKRGNTQTKTGGQSSVGTSGESTFDIDEFFSAALERTYKDAHTSGSDTEE